MTVKMTSLTYRRGFTAHRGGEGSPVDTTELSVTMEIDGDDPDAVMERARTWVKTKLQHAMKDE